MKNKKKKKDLKPFYDCHKMEVLKAYYDGRREERDHCEEVLKLVDCMFSYFLWQYPLDKRTLLLSKDKVKFDENGHCDNFTTYEALVLQKGYQLLNELEIERNKDRVVCEVTREDVWDTVGKKVAVSEEQLLKIAKEVKATLQPLYRKVLNQVIKKMLKGEE